MIEKRTPAAERRRETGTRWLAPPSRPSLITGRIPGPVPGRESVLTRSGEPAKRKMTSTLEPKDKLDATTTVVVNGPEGATLDWPQIDWRAVEASVRCRRQRIFTTACLSRMR
jgi:hypothetical protein